MKILNWIILSFFILTGFTIYASNFKTEQVYFDIAASKLKNTELEKLKNVSDANQVFLIGHTDADGDSNYNLKLSKSRVESVLQFLLENGVSNNNIDIAYFGEEKPINENLSDAQKALNRRVEIKYIKDPLMDFEVEKQVFDINDNAETIIKGKDGTEIIIPANTFNAKNVKLELQEFYSNLDILSSNLSTKANGELLETSGMIYLEANSNGKKVEAQNYFTIKFKKMSDNESFQLFEGNRSKEDLDMNWNLAGEEINIVDEEIDITGFSFGVNWTWLHRTNNRENVNWSDIFHSMPYMVEGNFECFDKTKILIKPNGSNNFPIENIEFENTSEFCQEYFLSKFDDVVFKEKLKNIEFLEIEFVLSEQEKLLAQMNELKRNPNAENAEKIETLKARYSTEQIVTTASNLGWINCDRFLRNIPKTDFVVKISDEMSVRMVVKSFNSFYNGHNDYKNENQQVFTKIPFGEKVTLICTSYKDGKILLAIEETTIGKSAFSDFNFEVVSKEELKTRISSI